MSSEIAVEIAALSMGERRALLERLLREKAAAGPPTFPLSHPQQHFWLMDQLDPGSPVYNSSQSVRLLGKLRLPALERSFSEIVRRHGILRTTFPVVDGEPVQRIALFVPLHLPLVDLGGLREEARHRELGRLAIEDVRRPFDLARGPVYRLTVVRLEGAEHVVLLTLHHIVFDGWSRGVLMREIAVLYDAFAAGRRPRLPELPIQYVDFARWQRGQGAAAERQLAYWQGQLAAPLPTLELPTDRPHRPAGRFRGSTRWLNLSGALVAELGRAGARQGVTLYMLLLAAYAVWLHRYSAQDDLLVGTLVANRKQREVEALIGLFINTLVMRLSLGGNPALSGLLRQVRQVALDAYAHEDVPFERVAKAVQPERDPSRGLLFQTLFMLLNAPADQLELTDLTLVPFEIDTTVGSFDLTLFLWETKEGLRGGLEYDSRLFEAATISRMLGHLEILLHALGGELDTPLADLPFLRAGEQAQLLAEWNDTASPLPVADAIALFAEQVRQSPNRAAASCRGETWTYADLDRRSDEVAWRLAGAAVGLDAVVVLLGERGLEFLAAVLGVWKAGGAYLPLDPRHPAERHRRVLEQVPVAAAVVARSFGDIFAAAAAVGSAPPPVFWLEEVVLPDAPDAPDRGGRARRSRAQAEGLAYVIFTSGSTGVPKGAMVVQRGMVNHLFAKVRDLRLTGEDVVAQTASQCFDISVWQFVAPLVSGGRVQIYPDEVAHDPVRLLPELTRDGVSVLEIVPSLLRALLEAALSSDEGRAALAGLRWMIPTGEALPPDLARGWLAALPDVGLLNAYGPTECSDDVSHHLVRAGDLERGQAPIGRPVVNTQLYVLGAGLEAVPLGVPGELWVGGAGVGRGYLGDAVKTAEAFRPDPFDGGAGRRLYRTGDRVRRRPDGALLFLGRIDHQVKIRGFRIELGEIEAELAALPEVAQAVVVVPSEGGGQRLIGFVVPHPESTATGEELRLRLQQRLPDSMIPSALELLDAMPLTANGKADRRALAARRVVLASAAGRSQPRSPLEELLAGIWRDVLRLDEVGVHDNFFGLGGDSILSLQVTSRARSAGLPLTPRQLFEHQTIADLAAAVGRTAGGLPVVAGAEEVSGLLPLLPAQRWFLDEDPVDPHHFNQAVLLTTLRRPEPIHLAAALAVLSAHHDVLRARFRRLAEGGAERPVSWQQEVAAPGLELLPFGMVDLGGLEAGRQRAALESAAAAVQGSLQLTGPVQRLVLFDLGDRPGRLLWVINHLVVDGVSWRTLLADLVSCWEALAAGRRPSLPARSTSVRAWAAGLESLAASSAAAEELAYCASQDWAAWGALPRDFAPAGAGRAASEREAEVVLGEEETRALLQEVPRAYNTRLDEVLLTALGRAYQEWSGAPVLLMELEGHGRAEDLLDGADLSRTVGWFTSFYPVVFDLRGAEGPGPALKEVKERLRRVPRGGAVLSALRYGAEHAAVASLPRAEIVFNYLGQLDSALPAGSPLGAAEESPGPWRSPRQARRHLFEWVGQVSGGRLRLVCRYSTEAHRRETAEQLAASVGGALRELIAHCRTPGAGALTPSDVPQARLTQAELDRLAPLLVRDPPLLVRDQVEDLYELTPIQEGLLFHSQLDPGSGFYNERFTCVLRGRADLAALRRAWEETVARHAVLRTDFLWQGVARPLQRVWRAVSSPWEVADWRELEPAEQEAQWARFQAADRRRDFVFDQAPLTRFAVFQLAADRHRITLTYHHILLDGWCLPLLLRDVFESYTALVRGTSSYRPAPAPFRSYLAWLHRQGLAGAEAYWRRELAGITAVTPLPGDRGVGDGRRESVVRRRQLSAEATARMAAFVRSQGLTLNTLVQGAWALLLARWSGERDVVFGATVAGRPADLAGSETMLGIFINTLPTRVATAAEARSLDWLRELQSRQAAARQFEHVPLATIQRWSDAPRGSALFESLLVFWSFPTAEALRPEESGLELEAVEFHESVHYPLHCVVIPGAELDLRLDVDPSRFEVAAVDRSLRHLEVLLAGLSQHPGSPLETLPWLTLSERAQILTEWNDTAALHPGLDVASVVAARAARSPTSIAVSCRGESWSYRELDLRATGVARRMSALGVGVESVVVLLADRGLEFLAAMLGVWRAGAAYLPLDPNHPAERHQRILAQVPVAAAILSPRFRGVFDQAAAALPAPVPIVGLEEAACRPPATPDDPALPSLGDLARLAYVIFTSGSTGVPKGAMVVQRGMLNHLRAKVDDLGLTSEDVIAQTASQCFDISVWQFVAPLLVGGRVEIYPDELAHDPELLLAALACDGVSVLEIVPSMLRALLETARLDSPRGGGGMAALSRLRWMIPTGEALPPDLARSWMSTLPGVPLLNAYGPTECSDDVTHHLVRPEDLERGPVPIGRPVANTRMYVLNGGLELLPAGAPGELWVGGAGVGRGYLGDAPKTALSFRPDPFGGEVGGRLYRTGDMVQRRSDGALLFAGRIDHQVKIRGFRIELEEIEAALASLPGVAQSVVVVQGEGAGKRLVAFVVAPATTVGQAGELRRALQDRLPEYMVPAVIEPLEELPLTANGKVDRRALASRQTTAAPDAGGSRLTLGPLEELLAGIWRDVLGREEVGVHDNYFALGGDSILSLQVVSRARRAGLALAPRQLFEHPTIAELAAVIAPVTAQPLVPGAEDQVGSVALLPAQRWFLDAGPVDPEHFNLTVRLTLQKRRNPRHLPAALAAVTAHHAALRASLRRGPAGWEQEVLAPGAAAAPCGVIDLAALSPAQLERALEAAAAAVQGGLPLAGPLQRLALCELGGDRPSHLLWAVHHLVVDGVSWRVLLEDLATCWEELEAGRVPVLPARTTPVRAWAESLAGLAASPVAADELSYWTAQPWSAAARLPRDFEGSRAPAGRVASERAVELVLGEQETQLLLQQVPRAYNSRLDDVLLAALARAYRSWSGAEVLLVELEGHGRAEELLAGADLSRTVGWLTSFYPVLLDLRGLDLRALDPRGLDPRGLDLWGTGPGEALREVKERLRRVPRGGTVLSALRYGVGLAELTALPRAEILFNNLGQLDRALPGGDAGMAAEALALARSPRQARSHLFEWLAAVSGGRLRLLCRYSGEVHRQETVERLAALLGAALRELIAHCTLPGVGGFTPSDLPLARLEQADLDRLAPALARDTVEDLALLTPMQEGLLFHAQLEPGSGFYCEQLACVLRGPLSAALLRQAWAEAIARHAVLRTDFLWQGLARPLQRVRRAVQAPWAVVDWQEVAPALQDRLWPRYRADDRRREFAFGQAPLLRFALFRLAPAGGQARHRLLFTFHHILLDGWSLPLLLREVFGRYEALARGEAYRAATPPPFRDYLAWLQDQDQVAAEEFWRRELAGFSAATPLPGDRGRGSDREQGREQGREQVREPVVQCAWMPASARDRLLGFARRHQLTLNAVVQGGWALLLARSSGERDVVFGATVAGRPADLAGSEAMIGVFINTLPVRVEVAGGARPLDWLHRLQERQMAARQLEHVPLAAIQRVSEMPAGTPLFESLLVFENYPTGESLRRPGSSLEIEAVEFFESVHYPLHLMVLPGAELELRLAVDPNRFEAAAVAAVLARLQVVLAGLAEEPDRLGEVPWLTPHERAQVLAQWNRTAAALPAWEVVSLFAAQAARTPAAPAAACAGETWSYAELDRRSGAAARRLSELGVGPESLVVLLAERGLELLAAILGVWKAGGAYLPLDPRHPAERHRRILEQVPAARVALSREFRAVFAEAAAALPVPPRLLGLEDLAAAAPAEPEPADSSGPAGARRPDPDGLAYVIFTSGSTGVPKGAMVMQRGMVNHLYAKIADLGLTGGDVVAQTASQCFDISVWQLVVPLLVGGRVEIIPTRSPTIRSSCCRGWRATG